MKKIVLMLVMMLMPTMVSAKDISTSGDYINERSILRSGDYLWGHPQDVVGEVRIRVNLATQMAYVWADDELVGVTNVSTGKEGFDTPQGTFTILGKEDNHWSKKYKADMPYTMWVTSDGVALHSGTTPGRRTSHGCIHLPPEFARLLFQVTTKGALVEIVNKHPADRLVLNL